MTLSAAGVQVKGFLIGQSADPDVLAQMKKQLTDAPQVIELYNLLTQQFGSEIKVAIKARMQPQGSAVVLIEAINRVDAGFRVVCPEVGWLFFEPDVED